MALALAAALAAALTALLAVGRPPPPAAAGVPTCGRMDVVFTVDTTGSMGPAIDSVKEDLDKIVNKIRRSSNGNFNLGLVTFKDDVVVENDLGSRPGAVKDSIRALSASGGGSVPEASDEALNTVVNGLDQIDRLPGQQTGDFNGEFRGNALKIAILITDALPGGFDDTYTTADDDNARGVARDAKDNRIRISSVYVPTGFEDPEEIRIMKRYARISDGVYGKTDSAGNGTAKAISKIIQAPLCGGREVEEEKKELKLKVKPKESREDKRTCFRFKVRSEGDPVNKAKVKFGGQTVKTNKRGKATICKRFRDPGERRAKAKKKGFERDRATVRIVRDPGFTG